MSVPQVSIDETLTLLASGAVLLDVREPHETDAGRAPQSVCVPMGLLSHESVPQGAELAVICRSGVRSDSAAQALIDAGYTAYNVSGGMIAWAAAGHPVVDSAGAPGAVV